MAGDEPDISEQQAMKDVVGQHMEELDELFLEVLTTLMRTAAAQREQQKIAGENVGR